MSIETPAGLEPGQEGLSFANALRDCLMCGAILLDAQGKVTLFSAEAAHILGMSSTAAVTASCESLPSPLPAIAKEALSSAGKATVRQVVLESKGRGKLTVRVGVIRLEQAGGTSGALLVLNDLTPAKRLERNLWQADRLASLGTLAASMAHEIKNALVAGRTFIDLLLEKHQDAELVEIVRREMGRIDSIVSRMLRFVGPTRRGFSTISLHEVLDHSLRLVQPQLAGKSLMLERSLEASPDLVDGDDYELEQAFVNLLLNALEAMGGSGTLTVATEMLAPETDAANLHAADEPRQLRVRIKDTGAGVAPENLARLFDPFFTTKPSGTGLGLAITQRIIQEHHGQITVESKPGEGTTFSIVLPVVPGSGGGGGR